MLHVEKTFKYHVPLQSQSSNEECNTNRRIGILLQESHHETKPNEDYHLCILEHCNQGQQCFRAKNIYQLYTRSPELHWEAG